jgi:hypothetical protein
MKLAKLFSELHLDEGVIWNIVNNWIRIKPLLNYSLSAFENEVPLPQKPGEHAESVQSTTSTLRRLAYSLV